jgi:hypothetical protein
MASLFRDALASGAAARQAALIYFNEVKGGQYHEKTVYVVCGGAIAARGGRFGAKSSDQRHGGRSASVQRSSRLDAVDHARQ